MKTTWITIPLLAGGLFWGVWSCDPETNPRGSSPTDPGSGDEDTRERGLERGGDPSASPRASPSSGDPEARPPTPSGVHRSPATVEDGVESAAVEAADEAPIELGRVIPGQGIDGQTGSIPTVAELLFSAYPEDTRVVVRTEPPEALAEVPPDGWIVRAGDRATLLRLAPQLDAPVDVWLERQDEAGAPVGPARHLRLEPRSIEAVDGPTRVGPELETRGPGMARGSRPIRGIPGLELGTLRWHRRPFARSDEVATSIELVADDPNGILAPLPRRIVIPAGRQSELQTEPLRLTERTGTARLHFRWDGREDSLEIRSEAPTWSVRHSPPRAPVGAVVAIESRIDPPWAEERTARCVLADDGRLELTGNDDRPLDRLRDVVLFELRARAIGPTRVRLVTPRLEPLVVEVLVTDPTVDLAGGSLRLHPALVRAGGVVHLTPIRGGVLQLSSAREVPAGLTVTTTGRGLRIEIGVDAPDAVLELDVRYEPPPRGLRFVRVDEEPRQREPTSYFVEVRE